MTTTPHHQPLDPALASYAQRLCQSAGTDLDAALAALTTARDDDDTAPVALRAGWDAADLPLLVAAPALDDQEPTA